MKLKIAQKIKYNNNDIIFFGKAFLSLLINNFQGTTFIFYRIKFPERDMLLSCIAVI